MSLKKYSDKELEEELLKRKEKEKLKEKKPVMIEDPDLSALKKICSEYVDYVVSEDYFEDNDWGHYIYETVIDTFFGKAFWDFINSR